MTASTGARPLRALFLVDMGPIPARVVAAWCASGHEIAEIRTFASVGRGAWKRDRRLGMLAPRWSLDATIRKYGIPHRRIESLADPEQPGGFGKVPAIDVVVSVHFPRILPASLLSRFTVPVVNVHPALLPAYRGPTPLISMILDNAQDRCSGVTIHEIVADVDAGPIFASRPVPFPRNGLAREWELDLARAAADLAVETIPRIVAGKLEGVPQSEQGASHRCATAGELRLTPEKSFATVLRLCRTLGRIRPLMLGIGDREYAVSGIPKHLGGPSGQPPVVGWLHIESDLADARVRLRRKPWWDGRRRRMETMLRRIFSP